MITAAQAAANLAHNIHAMNCPNRDLRDVRTTGGALIAHLCATCDRQLPLLDIADVWGDA